MAREHGLIETLAAQCKSLSFLADQPGVLRFLTQPQVPAADKKAFIDSVMSRSYDEALVDFVKLLIDKNRIAQVRRILDVYDQLMDIERGVQEAVVTTAVPLMPEQQEALLASIQRFSDLALQPTFVVDPSILAGAVARLGRHTYIDGSLRTRLAKMKRSLMIYEHF
jgi:F-type H+-transporting ATPase subunit delta